VLAGLTAWRDHTTVAIGFASLGGVLLLGGLAVPGRLGPIYRAWMGLALIISRITTPVFMAITYFLVLAPTGFLVRIFAGNPMLRKSSEGTFWIPRPEGSKRRSNLERQF
jgi:hypothetical protein